jgi:hypothetical protein
MGGGKTECREPSAGGVSNMGSGDSKDLRHKDKGIHFSAMAETANTGTTFLELLTIAGFEDVHLREVNTWVIVVVNHTILRTQVLCTEKECTYG